MLIFIVVGASSLEALHGGAKPPSEVSKLVGHHHSHILDAERILWK